MATLCSDEIVIFEINSENALINPSSTTVFLSKFISKGLEISILSMLKDFALTLSVEKKNKTKDRNKIYIRFLNIF